MKKKTIKGSQILSKLQGLYTIREDRGYNLNYEVMRGTLKECFAWIREFAPIRASVWYDRGEWISAYDDMYLNPFDDDMRNGDGYPLLYYIERIA